MTMNEQNKDNLNDPGIRKLFEDKNFVFLSSLMKDGSPQVTPTWVDIENGNILINTAKGRIKQKNISRDPRVALAVVDQNNPYKWVPLKGKELKKISEITAKNIKEK